MATPKHILRIHDTEANLFANLKDKQIAFATDTNRIIWREGADFWTFDAGLKWNGANFEGNEVSTGVIKVYQFNGTEALQIGDGGGNPNLLTTGTLTLNADILKLTIANKTGTADKLLALTSAGKVIEADISVPTQDEINAWNQIQSTGILEGGALSSNADPTKWDLASGSAIVMDFTDPSAIVPRLVTWTGQTALTITNLGTQAVTNVAIALDNSASTGVVFTNSFTGTIDSVSGTIYIAEKLDNFSTGQRRDYANLGRLVHNNLTSLQYPVQLQFPIFNVMDSITDFIGLFPAQNVEGNNFTPTTGVNKSVDKDAGKGFRIGSNFTTDIKDPNVQDIPSVSPTSHKYRYQDGSGGWTDSGFLTELDPDNYDDGSGTPQSVAVNKWTIQPVWVFAGSGSMYIQYGQEEFASLSACIEALGSLDPVLNPQLTSDAVFRGYFLLKQGMTDTNDSSSFVWRAPLSERGGGSGTAVVTDLQTAYNNSSNPEITTDATRGALTIKRGSALDTDCVIEVQNGAGTQKLCISGDGVLNLASTTKASPTNGDVWFNSSDSKLNFRDGDLSRTLNNGLGYLGSLETALTDANASTLLNSFFLTGGTWTGSPYAGTDARNQGHIAHLGFNSIYAHQVFYPLDSSKVVKIRSKVAGTWGDWSSLLSSKPSAAEMVYNLASTANASPSTGDIWRDSTSGAVEIQGDLKVNASNINFTGLPTSSAGLSAGDLWNDAGTLKIV